MTFIKTENPITIEAESGEIFRIAPVGGVVHIEIEQFTEESEESDYFIDRWKNEDNFAKPEWQRKQDWIPEDEDEEEYKIKETSSKKPNTDLYSWPLP